MKNYKRIGDFIRLVDERNKGLQVKLLLGLSISKEFIPSVDNIVETGLLKAEAQSRYDLINVLKRPGL